MGGTVRALLNPVMKNVLIVDDEKNFRLTLSVWLREFADEFNALMAADGQEAVEVLQNTPVDLLLTDLKMPRMDGFGLLSYMKQNHPSLPVIVMTAYASAEVTHRLRGFESLACLEKPIDCM